MMRNLTTAAEGLSPYKSKWIAAEKKGEKIDLKDENILYLGASSGTTVGFISELTNGIIFAVENAPEMAVRLVRLASKKQNIAPVFCDARDVEKIKEAMFGKKTEILFQDIPARDQVEILINASSLVDKNCRIFLSLKTQSISQRDASKTFQDAKKRLSERFEVIKGFSLEPYHKKHYFFVLRKK